MNTKITNLIAAGVLAGMSLSSCYFNSAGYIVDAASHDAAVRTQDLKAGQVVYTNGSSYYIEVPHYRYDTPMRLQYHPWYDKMNKEMYGIEAKYDTSTKLTKKGDSVMVQIPADFGRYLTGESTAPFHLDSKIKMVDNPDIVKTYTRKPIVNLPKYEQLLQYDYSSPNSGWLYTAAVFDWLLVDMPVTVTENALMAVATWLIVFGEVCCRASEYNPRYESSSSSNDDWAAQQSENYMRLQNQQEWQDGH